MEDPAEGSPNPDQAVHEREGDRADRRGFLLLLAAGGAALATAIAAVPVLGFLLTPVRRGTADVWRDVGPVDDFPVGSTTRVTYPDPDPDPWSGTAVRNAAWLRRTAADQFVAFSLYCTHTGCPVRWMGEADLFMCPCHGGVFDRDGQVAAGPPPRPLERPPVRIRDGRVEIQTTGVPTPS